MMILYHIAASLVFLLVLPFLPLVWLASEKRRANLLQRLGMFTGIPKKKSGAYRIWIHALSVGEVNSALPFVRRMKEEKPNAQIIFTASTRTGFETARRLMGPEKEGSPLHGLGYFPFDLWGAVLAVAGRVRPDLVCLVETDLWPGFLSIMKGKQIPVVLVNARISPRSLKGYLRLGRATVLFFSGLSHIMAQTREDAAGFRRLGVSEARISVTGNMKFDQPRPEISPTELEKLRERFGIRTGQPVWIAGSTHPGEEAMVVEAFSKIKENCPELRLIIAPRDPNRTGQLLKEQHLAPFATARLSDSGPEKSGADILFIDSMGELAMAYALCDFAFVGGSLVSCGGHNPLEPAMFAKPVLFGPHMTDFSEMERLLLDGGGAERVDGSGALAERAGAMLADAGRCRAMGEAALKVFLNNVGALDRMIKRLDHGFLH
ncbi:MAG: 3-deoxy-D-manno-octulosonic acid transferase [Desulfobacter sp.]|nr:MAG: 3-deoxy-D-manno-octulosonic acid transferase [Desulfobacter sp.]